MIPNADTPTPMAGAANLECSGLSDDGIWPLRPAVPARDYHQTGSDSSCCANLYDSYRLGQATETGPRRMLE